MTWRPSDYLDPEEVPLIKLKNEITQDIGKIVDKHREENYGEITEFWSLVYYVVAILLGTLFPMVTFGALYYDNCPADPVLPQLLIFGGLITFAVCIAVSVKYMRFMTKLCNVCHGWLRLYIYCSLWIIIAMYFIWLIYSLCKVAEQYDSSSDPQADDYCHPFFYNFFATVLFISFAVLLLMTITSNCFEQGTTVI
ncbi:uncharacterized protein LOC135945033 isoform X2 [Cloeon dipterum]|uniref:uncharacterized protein LOC135945033 isoform X2 n=1 Tax=Cloeon dipterum TaxID=197152 RepID=UPI00321F6264